MSNKTSNNSAKKNTSFPQVDGITVSFVETKSSTGVFDNNKLPEKNIKKCLKESKLSEFLLCDGSYNSGVFSSGIIATLNKLDISWVGKKMKKGKFFVWTSLKLDRQNEYVSFDFPKDTLFCDGITQADGGFKREFNYDPKIHGKGDMHISIRGDAPFDLKFYKRDSSSNKVQVKNLLSISGIDRIAGVDGISVDGKNTPSGDLNKEIITTARLIQILKEKGIE